MIRQIRHSSWQRARSVLTRLGLGALIACTATSALHAQTVVPGDAIGLNKNGKVASATDYTAYPALNASAVAPLVMLVMSRDEQLFIKAYTDYTDLDGDGQVDVTYNDNFNYSGYFDPNICYKYGSSQFKGSAAATGTGAIKHKCDGSSWSGNFLNWVTMSRLDLVRYVLYGGYRSTDTAAKTVLSRAVIPNDLHAWAKVYTGSDVNKFTPFTQDASKPGIAFCNASTAAGGTPQMRVAKGNWTEWASTASRQCDWNEDAGTEAKPDVASKSSDGLGDKNFNVVVEVCDPSTTATVRESFCQRYGTSTTSFKPVGLLQRYGENGQMRFGLMTGSFSAPRSGGVLRRNIGKLAANGTPGSDGTYSGCVSGDEINLADGTFCNQAASNEGIINTLNGFALTQWNWTNNWTDCNNYSIYNRQVSGESSKSWLSNPGSTTSLSGYSGTPQKCSAWGNPLSEMYAEALRYISGQDKTAGFTATGDLSALPTPAWLDPYGKLTDTSVRNPYCAGCSIIVLSTGLNSFDSDEIPSVSAFGTTTAESATDDVATAEGISGNYVVGRVGTTPVGTAINTHEDLCKSQAVSKLSLVRGICPDIPSMEGSYMIAGLANKAWTLDMRPGLKTPKGLDRPQVCDSDGKNCVGYKNRIQTYAVALAENLPKFTIPLGTSGSITLAPMCQANNSGTAAISGTGWRSCYLGAVGIGPKTATVSPKYIYGRDLRSDGLAGSFSLVWEDSLWGNDHDNDVVSIMTYCVGATCKDPQQTGRKNTNGTAYTGYDICWRSDSTVCTGATTKNQPVVGDDEVLVRIETLSAYAGNAMLSGYSVTGSNDDGVKRLILRPGDKNGSFLTVNGEPTTSNNEGKWTLPQVAKYKVGSGASAKQLENPLFYAAKYGGFTDVLIKGTNTIATGPCDPPKCEVSNWDRVDNNTGQPRADGKGDGLPDTFFAVRNPGQLGERLADVFNKILARSGSGTSAAVVSSSANGDGLTYQALYQAQQQNKSGSQKVGWTGSLNALWTDNQGRMRIGGYSVNGVPTMGDITQSKIVIFCTTTAGDSRFKTYDNEGDLPPNGVIAPAACAGETLDKLTPVWSAQNSLSSTSLVTDTQRTYSDVANNANGRYIFTWVDANHNGVVDDGEQIPFLWGTSAFTGTGDCSVGSTATGNYRFLNTCSAAGAQKLVSWVRGTEPAAADAAAWRTRTIDTTVLRLGDIINSTPLAVGTPAEAFDLLYGDKSYGSFRRVYQQRRQMVYVGANDGMLHAFNGGFYDASAHQLNTQPKTCDTKGCKLNNKLTAHPLGSEVWAYVPGNLLPHLRWMADPAYAHMFYVDGSPISQDVRIFTGDNNCTLDGTTQCHPDGWGTILIVPFRFGGGAIGVDTKLKAGTTNITAQNSFSAYVVLDVTNPEAAPRVLAELTQVDLSGTTCSASVVSCSDITKLVATYTSSVPAVAMFRPKNQTNPDPSKFFLFTGSGTTDNGGVGKVEGGSAASTVSVKIRSYDLASVGTAVPARTLDFVNTGSTGAGDTSFAGDLIASDFDLDGVAESLYFGSVKGAAAPFGGSVWAIDFGGSVKPTDWTRRSVISGLDRPVSVRPTLGINDAMQKMVFFGTGRAYTKGDMADTQRQRVVGVVDSTTAATYTGLFDVTNVVVDTSGNVTGLGSDSTIKTTFDLQNSIGSGRGWTYQLSNTSGTTTIPSERVISAQALSAGVLLTTSYIPGTDTCTDQGDGFLYGMNYRTGSPDPALVSFLGTVSSTSNKLNRNVSLGAGLPSQPSLHRGGTGEGGKDKLRVCVQTSSGAIICYDVKGLQGVNSGEISWREPLTK